jgi:hypothetical protein
LGDGAELRPAGEQMSLQMQPEAASPVADDLAPPPVAPAPVQVSWTGLAPPVEAAVSAVTEPTVPEPTLPEAAISEPTSTAEPAAEVESTAPPAEKKVVWSSSPSNSTISFGPGYSSRRDDV